MFALVVCSKLALFESPSISEHFFVHFASENELSLSVSWVTRSILSFQHSCQKRTTQKRTVAPIRR